jgi:predicted transcriptional regulator
MESEWYIIKDIEKFIDTTRILVFNNFVQDGKDDINFSLDTKIDSTEELDQVLSYNESDSIIDGLIKKEINKKSKKIRYLLSDDLFLDIVESLNSRMVSNILSGLVSKGLVETAFDDSANDFIFWIKDENKEQLKKDLQDPETN